LASERLFFVILERFLSRLSRPDRTSLSKKLKNMTRLVLPALLFIALSCTTADLQRLGSLAGPQPLTGAEVAAGLKEALQIGIGKGTERLSAVDGFFKSPYKILLPPEARQVTDRLQAVPGFGRVEDIVLEKINRGAESAAKKALPIFTDAIKQMSFSDAMGILKGEQDAATQYLRRTSYQRLYDEFRPVIIASLDEFDARKYWSDAVGVYNKIPLVSKANPELDDYVTRQALEGLFGMVAQEEANIRQNVSARTTELLRRVFGE
jgi:hypothetical protein